MQWCGMFLDKDPWRVWHPQVWVNLIATTMRRWRGWGMNLLNNALTSSVVPNDFSDVTSRLANPSLSFKVEWTKPKCGTKYGLPHSYQEGEMLLSATYYQMVGVVVHAAEPTVTAKRCISLTHSHKGNTNNRNIMLTDWHQFIYSERRSKSLLMVHFHSCSAIWF